MRLLPWVLFVVAVCGMTTAISAAEKDYTSTDRFPSNSGKHLVVDVASLDIKIRGADVREIEISSDLHISGISQDRADGWIEQHTPSYKDSANQLSVSAAPGRSGFLGLGLLTARARLNLVIPTAVLPDLTTTSGSIGVRGDFADAAPFRIRTASGDIDFDGAARGLDIRTASGDSHLEVLRPFEDLFARSSSGDVVLVGGARSVRVDTSSGNIWLTNLSGSAVIETSDGKVTLRWDRLDPEHTVKVRSSTGRINLILPADASPRGKLSTISGSIRSGFPGVVDDNGSAVSLAGTGATFDVATTSGEILLSQGDE